MSAPLLAPGQRVRIATVPADILPWVDTGTLIRRMRVHDAATGEERDGTSWVVRFDLLHLERGVPEGDVTPLETTGDAWLRIWDSAPQRPSARSRKPRRTTRRRR